MYVIAEVSDWPKVTNGQQWVQSRHSDQSRDFRVSMSSSQSGESRGSLCLFVGWIILGVIVELWSLGGE